MSTNARTQRLIVSSYRITEAELAVLQKLAKRENRSISGQLRHLIKSAATKERERERSAG